MKKNIFVALIALLAVTVSALAQGNTYNMVIEMQNGSKITIGPNDVKNISFNNGALVISGSDITSIVENNTMTAKLDSLAKVLREELSSKEEAAASTKDVATLEASLAALSAQLQDVSDNLEAMKAETKNELATLNADIAQLQKSSEDGLAASVAKLEEKLQALEESVAQLSTSSSSGNFEEDMIALKNELMSQIVALKESGENMQKQIAGISYAIDANQESIAKNSDAIAANQASIAANSNKISEITPAYMQYTDHNVVEVMNQIDATKAWVEQLEKMILYYHPQQ